MMNRVTFVFAALALFLSPAKAQEKPSSGCDHHRQDSLIVTHAEVPLYPPLAVQAHLSGTVDIRITVKGGAVVTADPVPGANLLLSMAAQKNVQTWGFASQSYGDFCVRYVYELDKQEGNGPSNSRVEIRFPDSVRIMATPPKPIESE